MTITVERRFILSSLMIAIFWSSLAAAQTPGSMPQADTATVAALFQQALYAEKTEGNLEKAIGLYEQIIDQAADVERVAAKALLQLAGCYEKKGDTAAAAKYYQQIIDECPTQKAAVSKATEKLADIKIQENNAPVKNLQMLIDSAKSGDTVIVKAGSYSKPIVITKPLTLRGESFQDCNIEVVSNSPAIQIRGVNKTGKVKLENLTINWQLESSSSNQSSPTEYVADNNTAFVVYILDSNVVINGCIIINREDKYKTPGGIYVKGFSKFDLTNSQIEGPFDYAVNFGEGTKGLVADCMIKGPDHQGVMLYNDADVIVVRNIIIDSNFHGVRTTGGKLTLRNNIIANNKNRGVYLGSQSGNGIIENNLIDGSGTGIGGFAMSEFTIRNNIISNSSYTGMGFEKSCRLMIENNIFYNNKTAWTMFDRGGTNGNGCRRNTFWANESLTEGFSHTGNSIIDEKSHFVKNDYVIDPKSEAAKAQQGLTDTEIFDTLFDRRKDFENYITTCMTNYSEGKSANEISKTFIPDASYMRDNEFMKFSLTQPNGMNLGTLLWRTKIDDKDQNKWNIESFMSIETGSSPLQQYTFVQAEKQTLKPTMAITSNSISEFEILYNKDSVNSKITKFGKTIEKNINVNDSVFDNEQAFYVIRSMSLVEGFDKSFMIYPPQSGVISECRIKVEGIEKIKFDGKETDCFKTKLICSAAGQTILEHTLWITTDPLHWVVKYDSGAAVMELVEYGVKDLGNDKEKIFETIAPASAAVTQTTKIDMTKKATIEEKKQAEDLRASGWRLFMQGKAAEAEEEFKKALALDPQMENGWQGLGWAQRNQAKNINAKESFEKCLAMNPKNAAALNGMGQIAQAENDIQKAEEYWKRGVAADASATGPMMGLAKLYEEKQDYKEAAKYYKMWLKAEPDNQMAKDGLENVMGKLSK